MAATTSVVIHQAEGLKAEVNVRSSNSVIISLSALSLSISCVVVIFGGDPLISLSSVPEQVGSDSEFSRADHRGDEEGGLFDDEEGSSELEEDSSVDQRRNRSNKQHQQRGSQRSRNHHHLPTNRDRRQLSASSWGSSKGSRVALQQPEPDVTDRAPPPRRREVSSKKPGGRLPQGAPKILVHKDANSANSAMPRSNDRTATKPSAAEKRTQSSRDS